MNFTDNTSILNIDYYGEARLFGVLNPARLYLQSLAPDFKTARLRKRGDSGTCSGSPGCQILAQRREQAYVK